MPVRTALSSWRIARVDSLVLAASIKLQRSMQAGRVAMVVDKVVVADTGSDVGLD